MMRTSSTKILLLCFALCTSTTSVHANVVLDAVDSGWYSDGSSHSSSNENYIVGTLSNDTFHNFFVFDVTPGTYTAGTLRLFNPDTGTGGYTSNDATETYVLYDVTTPINTLVASGGTQPFTDVGTGTAYGSAVVSTADNGEFVDVTLNSAGLAAVSSANGLFAIGGSITTAPDPTRNQHVFGYTSGFPTPQLLLSTNAAVPEPASLAIFSLLLLSAIGQRVWSLKR